ncbi:hypothetical protein POM88_004796 [Heracleum sosnowskyi]|uniref:Cyclin C-terminal domain-containing protein n=1 Tax=Heracleum sosnowskyi TaxID=360622 RepID=A0AAD8JM89_9APIA|nr:hypothetical protein POM88_004796 [Heracleum sosnowskyi]
MLGSCGRRFLGREELEETERLLLFGNESELIMLPEYSNNSKARHYREQALDYYQSIHNPHTMDEMVPYVAINFFDRVISKNRDPPLDRKTKFGNQRLMKMEMKILHALDWKMKQTVPFHFVPYFLHFLTLPRGFTRLLVHKIIVWTQADIRFTKFRPSTVAASAILCALAKLFSDDPTDVTSVILSRYAHFDSTVKDKPTTKLVPDEASTAPSGSGKESVEEGSQRHIKETVAEEASEAVAGIQMVPEQSSSPADGQESLEEGAQRQGKESVAEEANTVVGDDT